MAPQKNRSDSTKGRAPGRRKVPGGVPPPSGGSLGQRSAALSGGAPPPETAGSQGGRSVAASQMSQLREESTLTEEQARALHVATLRKAYRADIEQQVSEKRKAKDEFKAEGRALREQQEEQDAVHNANEQRKTLERKKLLMETRLSCEKQMEEQRQRRLEKLRLERQEGLEIREEDARVQRMEEDKRLRAKAAMRADFQEAADLLEARARKRKADKQQDVKDQLKAMNALEEQWRLQEDKKSSYFKEIQAKQTSIQGGFARITGAAEKAKRLEEERKQERDEQEEQDRWRVLLEKRDRAREAQRQDMMRTLDRQVEEERRRKAEERAFRNTLPLDMQMEIRERKEAQERSEKKMQLKEDLLAMIEEKRRRQTLRSSAGSIRSTTSKSIFAETEDEFYAHIVGENHERIRPYEGWELTSVSSFQKLPPTSQAKSEGSTSHLRNAKNSDYTGLSSRVDAARFLDKPLGRVVNTDLGKSTLVKLLQPSGSRSMSSLPRVPSMSQTMRS